MAGKYDTSSVGGSASTKKTPSVSQALKREGKKLKTAAIRVAKERKARTGSALPSKYLNKMDRAKATAAGVKPKKKK